MADVSKPGDLFLGVIDVFAVLVPGLAGVGLILWDQGKLSPKLEGPFLLSLLVPGYLLGHAAFGLGSVLDWAVYDRLFRPSEADQGKSKGSRIYQYRHKNDMLFRLARQVAAGSQHSAASSPPGGMYQRARSWLRLARPVAAGSQHSAAASPPGGMYQWARSWLRLRSPEATAEIDRAEANSKLFRGLCPVVAGYSLWHWRAALANGAWSYAIAATLFLLWRYCDLRQKSIRTCYLAYIQLQQEAPASAHA